MSSLSPFGHRQAAAAPQPADLLRDNLAAAAYRRRHLRVPLSLRGRYMLACGREYPCVTRDVSRMGMAIEGVEVGAVGERVVAYLEELGRVEGRIIRRAEDWFAIELVGTPQKLERLGEKISAIVRRTTERREATE